MAVVKPFRAVRPTPELVDKVAALPYDGMDTKEAIEYVEGNDGHYDDALFCNGICLLVVFMMIMASLLRIRTNVQLEAGRYMVMMCLNR
mgnify:CR=1 FL=1